MEQRALFSEHLLRPTPNPTALIALREAALSCRACGLAAGRTQVVFGHGNGDGPAVAFVGEAPGADEDAQGVPFIGRAGQLLNSMITAMGLARDTVYIANVVNCRPPANRRPQPEEITACFRHLTGQLRAVRPRVIVALGLTAAQALLKSKKPVAELRGRWHDWEGTPVRVSFHPAYLLRSPNEKKVAWIDLKEVMKMLGLEQVNNEHVFAPTNG